MSDPNTPNIDAAPTSGFADLASVRAYYTAQAEDYRARISAIEAFLGFAESSAELGARLERLENFVGVKKV